MWDKWNIMVKACRPAGGKCKVNQGNVRISLSGIKLITTDFLSPGATFSYG